MPRTLPASKKRAKLGKLSYESLVAVLRDGRPVIDPRTGEQRRDESGKGVFTPATAADHGQARMMRKELEAETETDHMNEYAKQMHNRTILRDCLTDLGYSYREAAEIMDRKRGRDDDNEV